MDNEPLAKFFGSFIQFPLRVFSAYGGVFQVEYSLAVLAV
jgi:hypothetical protein